MALLTLGELQTRAARQFSQAYPKQYYSKSAHAILEEQEEKPGSETFDIFLSHSYKDAKLNNELMLALKDMIRDLGFSVYVDWIVDEQLHRDHVNKETARTLRNRMDHCESLFFAASDNSPSSIWMPWELGYMDGKKDRVAIFPLLSQPQAEYKGQEYLGVYPYVDVSNSNSGTPMLWIHESKDEWVSFQKWLKGEKPAKKS